MENPITNYKKMIEYKYPKGSFTLKQLFKDYNESELMQNCLPNKYIPLYIETEEGNSFIENFATAIEDEVYDVRFLLFDKYGNLKTDNPHGYTQMTKMSKYLARIIIPKAKKYAEAILISYLIDIDNIQYDITENIFSKKESDNNSIMYSVRLLFHSVNSMINSTQFSSVEHTKIPSDEVFQNINKVLSDQYFIYNEFFK